jgi:hypothetical protein
MLGRVAVSPRKLCPQTASPLRTEALIKKILRGRLSLNTPCRSVTIHRLLFLPLLAKFFRVPASPSTLAPTLHFLQRADPNFVTDYFGHVERRRL